MEHRLLMNGETVHGQGCYPSRIVLRHFVGKLHPFVVHMQVIPGDRPTFYVTGGYHCDLSKALEEFTERRDQLEGRR